MITRIIYYTVCLTDLVLTISRKFMIGLVIFLTALMPLSLMGVLAGKLEFYRFLGMFAPHLVVLVITGSFLLIQKDLNKCKEVFSAIINSKKEALVKIHGLEAKKNALDNNIKALEEKEIALNETLKKVNNKISENHAKHENWIKNEVPQIRAKRIAELDRELDLYAKTYAINALKKTGTDDSFH